jgi:CRP-like cAMP-binding protein
MSECILHFLEEKNMPSITKKKHTYLMIDGHDQEYMYVLKEGIIKVSVILCDGREFNITYIDTLNKLGYKAKINTHTTSYIN